MNKIGAITARIGTDFPQILWLLGITVTLSQSYRLSEGSPNYCQVVGCTCIMATLSQHASILGTIGKKE